MVLATYVREAWEEVRRRRVRQSRITRWWRHGIQGTTIHGALVLSHRFTGSYSSVRCFLAGLEAAHPQVSTVLELHDEVIWLVHTLHPIDSAHPVPIS